MQCALNTGCDDDAGTLLKCLKDIDSLLFPKIGEGGRPRQQLIHSENLHGSLGKLAEYSGMGRFKRYVALDSALSPVDCNYFAA